MDKIVNIEVIWRLVRGAVATAVVQTFALQTDWTNLDQALRVVIISLVTGFLLALGKALRDEFGNKDTSKGVINKMPL